MLCFMSVCCSERGMLCEGNGMEYDEVIVYSDGVLSVSKLVFDEDGTEDEYLTIEEQPYLVV